MLPRLPPIRNTEEVRLREPDMLVIANGPLAEDPAQNIADSQAALGNALQRLACGLTEAGEQKDHTPKPKALLVDMAPSDLGRIIQAARCRAMTNAQSDASCTSAGELLARMKRLAQRAGMTRGLPADAAGQLALALLGR